MKDLREIDNYELVGLYPKLLKELKARKIIKTRNLVGELGKYIIEQTFRNDPELPNLFAADNSQKNFSFTSSLGDRFNVKTTSGNNTGVFHSVPLDSSPKPSFEFLVILKFSKEYEPLSILLCKWTDFLIFRQIKRPEGKWYVQLSPEFVRAAKQIKPLNL